MITGLVNFNSTNSAVRITDTPHNYFNRITFWGYKSFATGIPIFNSNVVYIGLSTGCLPIAIATGDFTSITLDDRIKNSLKSYYTIGTSGDGLYYMGW